MAIDKIDILKQRLQNLPKVLPQLLAKELKELAPIIEDLNTKQLSEGLRPDNSLLPDYSPNSVKLYGKKAGPMTMHDTGAFYRGLIIKVGENDIEFDDTDSKDPMLAEKYGNLKGLTDSSLLELKNDYLEEELSSRVKNYISNGIQ